MAFAPIQQLPGASSAVGLPILNGGSAPNYVKINIGATTDPGVLNDSSQGYEIFSHWINTATGSVWLCVSAAVGDASWQRLDNANLGNVNVLQDTQSLTNSFLVGQVIRRTTSGYSLARANSISTAYGTIGVIRNQSASSFNVVYSGILNWPSHGFGIGALLYLSAATAGSLTTIPTGDPNITIPIGVVVDNSNILVFPNTQSPPRSTWGGIDGGAANSYGVTLTPSPASYYAGLSLSFIPSNSNTSASTLNVNGIGAVSILRDGVAALNSGDIVAGRVAQVLFDGTVFQLLNPFNSGITNTSLVGSVTMFCMSSPPIGWLIANGAPVSRSIYALLFAAIGTSFGAGDGSTTFNLPDLRGQFIRGIDGGRGVDPSRSLGSLQADASQGHTHTAPLFDVGLVAVNTGTVQFATYNLGNPAGGIGLPVNDGTHGVPRTASETRPTNVALLPCIKY